MDVRRKAVAALTAVTGLLVAVLVALFAGPVPTLSSAQQDAAPSTVRMATGAAARVAVQQPGALVVHQVRSGRGAGSGPGVPAACPPSSGVVLPFLAGAVAPAVTPPVGPRRTLRCVDGRAPPAAQPLAVPLSLG